MSIDWRQLYDLEYPRLLRALAAMGGNREAAEDAAQEAFVRAHRHGLAGIDRPGAWLLVVGTRELFRQRRRLRRESGGLDAAAGSAGPSAYVGRYKRGLGHLPDEHHDPRIRERERDARGVLGRPSRRERRRSGPDTAPDPLALRLAASDRGREDAVHELR